MKCALLHWHVAKSEKLMMGGTGNVTKDLHTHVRTFEFKIAQRQCTYAQYCVYVPRGMT